MNYADHLRTHWQAMLLVCLAFLLRIWTVGDVRYYTGDQGAIIPGMNNYLTTGHFSPDSWEQPPLNYYLLKGSMLLFGNNAYGWRMKNVLASTLTVLILYLLGLEVFSDRRIALLAGLFYAIDPLALFFSQTIHGETSSICFFLLALLLTLRYLRGSAVSPLLAGLCLGLAIGQKWYFIAPSLLLYGLVVLTILRRSGFRLLTQLHLVSVYIILPLCIYLLAYTPWFGRGYTLGDFTQLQGDMYRQLQDQELESFGNAVFRNSPSNPWQWFLIPIIYAVRLAHNGARSVFLVFMNNPPVWLLTLLSIPFVAYRAWKATDKTQFVIPLFFFASYLPFIAVDRPLFLYSALVVIPYAFLASSFAIVALLDALAARTYWFWTFFGSIAGWGLYLYPLVMFLPVPEKMYSPLFSLGVLIGN